MFHAIVNYIDSYLDRYHHPKEDSHLFPAVRRCCPQTDSILRELEDEHRQGVALLHDLRELGLQKDKRKWVFNPSELRLQKDKPYSFTPTRVATYDIGCNNTAHAKSGMVGMVRVI